MLNIEFFLNTVYELHSTNLYIRLSIYGVCLNNASNSYFFVFSPCSWHNFSVQLIVTIILHVYISEASIDHFIDFFNYI